MTTLYATKLGAPIRLLLLLILLLASISLALAQDTKTLSGSIIDKNGAGLPGATVLVKGTANGSSTNERGLFTIQNVTPGSTTLVVSFVGYTTKEVVVQQDQRGKALTISLADDSHQIDEVIVTGVFDKRERMDASIAISTLSANQIALQVPASAADLLKNVPGVYVNSSLGEIRSTVYSRGVSAGSVEAATGYYYVSMQEDGLPVTNATYNNFGPDYFLRADATIGRLEAVRGGSAAITGPNAPGGIFNYVSKTGGQAFSGEVRLKSGIEGNGNGYYRADVDLGGKLNQKGDWTYNVGGFYRYANGARNPGYPMNQGGQGKFNIIKTYDKGTLKLYGKYLDDHNGWFEFLPATNFSDPQLAPGVKNTDTYLPNKSLTFNYPFNSAGDIRSFDPSNLAHSKDRAIGLDWQHRFGGGWSFQNNVKYTNKDRNWSSGAAISPTNLDGIFPYLFIGALGTPGVYTFKDHLTGQTLATTTQTSTGAITLNDASKLPGQGIQANSVLFLPVVQFNTRAQEVLDQGSVSKQFGDRATVTLGGYLGATHLNHQSGAAAVTLGTLENNPHPIDVTAVGTSGQTYQFTNAQGAASLGSLGGNGFSESDFNQTQLSSFVGLTYHFTPKLTFDGGVRYDHVKVKGYNRVGTANTGGPAGGLDGNPLTVYDNLYGVASASTLDFDKMIETVSFSGALNYRFSPSVALYGRYSDGKKAPDLDIYIAANTPFVASTLEPVAQHVQQLEFGLKVQKDKINYVITPFLSYLSNVATFVGASNADGTQYNTPSVYNSIRTYGVELETNYTLSEHLSVRAVGTVQRATANKWQVWVVGNPGAADDITTDYSGNRADNVPNFMFNVSPTYSANKFYVFVNYRYLGNRAANVPNTFKLPGFSQFDGALGYNLTSKLSLQANINNIFNTNGVMSFLSPGGFPASLDRQGFTPDKLAANPNATFSILTIQPRSSYLTAIYKF
ncbi:MAG: TonB-dependent receptor [Janthinobacterium lividum]